MLSASASFLLTRGATRLASKPVTIRRAMSTVDLTPYKVKAQEAIDGNDVMVSKFSLSCLFVYIIFSRYLPRVIVPIANGLRKLCRNC